MRDLAATIDPALRFDAIETLDESRKQEQLIWRMLALGGFLTPSVLLLSAAGIYALMSSAGPARRALRIEPTDALRDL